MEQLFYLLDSRTTILAFRIHFLELMGCMEKFEGVQEDSRLAWIAGYAGRA